MADTIQAKRGNAADIPTLHEGELGLCKDTKEVYIGTSDGNEKVHDPARVKRLDDVEYRLDGVEMSLVTMDEKKLTASAAATIAEIASDAELSSVITAFNALVAALKASGVMEE